MAGPVPVELSRDCASCGLEDGVIEVYDARVAACRFGVPAHARCRLCAEVAQGVVDRAVVPSLDALPANCCPACARPMEPRAVDERCCPMCGARAEERRVLSPVALDTREAFEAALDAWATRDGFASREELLGAVWDIHGNVNTRTVDVHVRRLRQSLGDAADWVETVHGFGYRARKDEGAA